MQIIIIIWTLMGRKPKEATGLIRNGLEQSIHMGPKSMAELQLILKYIT